MDACALALARANQDASPWPNRIDPRPGQLGQHQHLLRTGDGRGGSGLPG
ncbi:MAG: hypothetical protein R2854_30945 [Caldilineaceae bacterium]